MSIVKESSKYVPEEAASQTRIAYSVDSPDMPAVIKNSPHYMRALEDSFHGNNILQMLGMKEVFVEFGKSVLQKDFQIHDTPLSVLTPYTEANEKPDWNSPDTLHAVNAITIAWRDDLSSWRYPIYQEKESLHAITLGVMDGKRIKLTSTRTAEMTFPSEAEIVNSILWVPRESVLSLMCEEDRGPALIPLYTSNRVMQLDTGMGQKLKGVVAKNLRGRYIRHIDGNLGVNAANKL